MDEKKIRINKYIADAPKSSKKVLKTARFYKADQISDSAKNHFDLIYLPLQNYNGECEGIILPPVIFDNELPKVEALMQKAKKNGARCVGCSHAGSCGKTSNSTGCGCGCNGEE